MTYSVKEMFLTLQGEGAQSGRAAVFIRFAGCNLWSGREADRAAAECTFCDTDFVGTNGQGGGKFSTAEALALAATALWQGHPEDMFCVLTGGEPMMQADMDLFEALKGAGFFLAMETNGTLQVPSQVDWICVSPKANVALVQTEGHELKLVFPQRENSPADFEGLDFENFYLQPLDGPALAENTALAVDYCLRHSKWRLSTQTHKIIGID